MHIKNQNILIVIDGMKTKINSLKQITLPLQNSRRKLTAPSHSP